jgi:mannosyltransferase OCH1-like enzyme
LEELPGGTILVASTFMNDVIQGLWIGERLSVLEQLSIRSFLSHGHPYHLYVYNDVRGVPEGVELRDANEILPASMIFYYSEFNRVAGFANSFRYKLLLDKGGWWADTDSVCLKPFDFGTEYVISSQLNKDGNEGPNCGNLKAPRGSDFASYVWDVCRSKDPSQLRWGETGPELVTEAVEKLGLQAYVKSAATFCPIPFPKWADLLDPNPTWKFGPETCAVHLWNEMWCRDGRRKNGLYHENCLYERLKRQYGLGPKTYNRWRHWLIG